MCNSYNELKKTLYNLPVTWYPALISVMIKCSIKNKIWKTDSNGRPTGLFNHIEFLLLEKERAKNE